MVLIWLQYHFIRCSCAIPNVSHAKAFLINDLMILLCFGSGMRNRIYLYHMYHILYHIVTNVQCVNLYIYIRTACCVLWAKLLVAKCNHCSKFYFPQKNFVLCCRVHLLFVIVVCTLHQGTLSFTNGRSLLLVVLFNNNKL